MYKAYKVVAEPGTKIDLKDFDPAYTGLLTKKEDVAPLVQANLAKLSALQELLYADNRYALLLIFQGMDAAGKDSTIKHVMSGVDPQGCSVGSFKQPSTEELSHDYLWRTNKVMPRRGQIGIFNRSYYEEVLITRVHPELVLNQRIPGIHSVQNVNDDFFARRCLEINGSEEYLAANGVIILKFFLHLSKEEQKKRFLARIDRPNKNWKFSLSDAQERNYWKEYQTAFEKTITLTSTPSAPWYIVPADNKWFMQFLVGDIIVNRLQELDLHFPIITKAMQDNLLQAKEMLLQEK